MDTKTKIGKAEAAKEFFNQNNCCQAVLLSFADELPVDREILLKLSGGMGGGMCRGCVCGAVSAACMILGLRQESPAASPEDKAVLKAETRRFYSLFTDQFGALDCRDLIGYDLNVLSEAEQAGESGVFEQLCPKLVGGAVKIIEDHF